MKRRTAAILVVLTAVLSSVLTSCGEAASAPKSKEPVFTKFSTYDFQMGRIVCIYINPDHNSKWPRSEGAVGTVSCVTDGGS